MSAAAATTTTTTTTYTLWLVPSVNERPTFAAEVLAASLSLSSPIFEPHVTLLALTPGLSLSEVTTRAESIARGVSALNVKFSGVEAGTDLQHWRFRCVFLKIALPDTQLEALFSAAKADLSASAPDDKFMPHLSLCYSECDAETRSKVCEKSAERSKGITNALLDRLQVWDCSGTEPDRWHCVHSINLGA